MAQSSSDVGFAARGQALLRSAYLLTGDLHAAEDLLQSALERCAGRWTRLTSQPEAYVRRVMYNENVSIWRRRKVRPESLVSELPDVATGVHDDATSLSPDGTKVACSTGAGAFEVITLATGQVRRIAGVGRSAHRSGGHRTGPASPP